MTTPDDRSLFELLASMTDTMLFVTDLTASDSLWVNDTLVQATGYTLEDYRFQRFENPYIPAEDVARVGAFVGAFLQSDATVSEGFVRNRFVDRWGGTLHVRTRVAKITWEGVPALLWSTTVEQREDASVEVEERYRSLVEAASDCIVRLRPDLTVHYSNRFFQQLVGLGPVQLRTTRFPDLATAPFRDEVEASLLGGTGRFPMSVPITRHDGGVAWLEGTFVRIERGDDAGRLQAVLHDSTERRQLDERVQRAQRRETLGEMAGGIAHDLNNILTGILGSATVAGEGVEAGTPLAQALSDIRLAALRAGQLSTSMLAYAGEGNAERLPVDVAELVGEMRALVASALGKGLELAIDVPSVALPVRADEVQLRQVVMNLIFNACDASRATGGVVSVKAGVQLAVTAPRRPGQHVFGPIPTTDEVVYVRVTDQGSGIAAEALARIFDPFFTTKGKGRGLGLAAALGILERHGGCARVVSEVGEGTEIEMWLPLCEEAVPQRVVRPQVHRVAPGASVLVVDDEPMLRKLARHALEPLGYEVLEAESGEHALDLLAMQSAPPTAMVLDQTMPGMGGDRTLVEVRAAFPSLPVVRTSGYAADPRLAEGDAYTLFLGKPYGLRQLAVAVGQAIAGDAG